MNGKPPSLEEFTNLVKEQFDYGRHGFRRDQRDRYFYGPEAQNYIIQCYVESFQKFQQGEIGEAGFRIGRVGAVASCLILMFE